MTTRVRHLLSSLFYIILLIVASFQGLSAQQITVLDYETSNPLPYVNILSANELFVTDNAGKTTIRASNQDTLSFRIIGYKTENLTLKEIINMGYVVRMSTSRQFLETVTISGSRWAESDTKIPQKIDRLSRDVLYSDNPQTAADLLGESDHVFIQKSQLGGGSPIIRGFSASRILLAIDGVRMNNAIFRSGNVQNVISIDPYIIETAEVAYGPGSVLYGSDAIGGVLNFYTIKPSFGDEGTKIGGNFNMRHSTANDEKTIHGDLSLTGKNWVWTTSATLSDYGSLQMGKNGPEDFLDKFNVTTENGVDVVLDNKNPLEQKPTKYSQWSVFNKLNGRIGNSQFINASIYYSETSDIPRYDRYILQSESSPTYALWNYGPQKWLWANIKYSQKLKSKWLDEVAIISSFQNFQESRLVRRFNQDIQNSRFEKLNILSLNVDARKSMKKSELFYGIEYVFNDVKSNGIGRNIQSGVEQIIQSRYPPSRWQSLGTYLSWRIPIDNNWTINIGSRYNLFKIDSDFTSTEIDLPFQKVGILFPTFSSNLSLTYSPTSQDKYSLILSTGMRAPNVDDIGKVFDSAPGRVVVPNPELKAETAYNLELNLEKKFHNNLILNLTPYYTYLNNAMVRRDFLLNGLDSLIYEGEVSRIQAIQNAAEAYVIGLQASVDIMPVSDILIRMWYSHQVGKEETDNGIRSRGRHVVPDYGGLRIQSNQNRLTIFTSMAFQGSLLFDQLPISERDKPHLYPSDSNGNPFAASFWTWDVSAQYRLHQGISISAGIENILDKRYRTYSSGITGPGRNFILSMNASF